MQFEVGDMRSIRWEAEFDCVVNWFSSFGYFDSATNRELLRGFGRALRPGGTLVLDQVSPGALRRSVEAGRGSMVQLVVHGLDLMVDRVRSSASGCTTSASSCATGACEARVLTRADRGRRARGLLRETGFERVRLVDERGERLGPDSRRRIAVAERAGESAGSAPG